MKNLAHKGLRLQLHLPGASELNQQSLGDKKKISFIYLDAHIKLIQVTGLFQVLCTEHMVQLWCQWSNLCTHGMKKYNNKLYVVHDESNKTTMKTIQIIY